MKYANNFKYLFFISFIGLVCFGFFNFPKSVKAAVVQTWTFKGSDLTDNTYTINADNEGTLVCSYVSYQYNGTHISLSVDSNSFFTAFDDWTGSELSYFLVYHAVNAGSNVLTFSGTLGAYDGFICQLNDGDLTFVSTSTAPTINSSNSFNATSSLSSVSGDSIFVYQRSLSGNGGYDPDVSFTPSQTATTTTQGYQSYGVRQRLTSIVSSSSDLILTFDYNPYSHSDDFSQNFVSVFSSATPPTPSINYLDYFGTNPFYAATNDYTDLWVQYDVCDGYSATSTYALVAEIDPGGENTIWYGIEKNFNTGCSGIYDLRVPTGSEEITGTGLITIYKDYFDEIDYGETVATSENFLATIYKPITQKNGYIYPLLTNNTLNINTDTASSGTINFSYNVCTDSGYSSTTRKFYLDTAGNNETTSLNSASTTITTCKGTSTITIQNSTSTPYNLDWLADIKYVNTDNYNTIYKSEPFKIHWFTYLVSTPETIQGINAHDLACSAEEWASSEGSWFNWTKLKCLTFQTILSIAFKITDQVSSLVNKLGNIVATIFPFNLPINIYESWNAARTEELPEELKWLEITDENNNVYLPIPPLLNGSATTTQMLIWGDDVFIPEGSTAAIWFGRFKLLTKYGIQAATILMFWLFGQVIINLIWPNKKEEEE